MKDVGPWPAPTGCDVPLRILYLYRSMFLGDGQEFWESMIRNTTTTAFWKHFFTAGTI